MRTWSGIISKIPFDKPVAEDRFSVNLDDKIQGIPYFVRTYFSIFFIYDENAEFEGCCILKKEKSSFSIFVILHKRFENSFVDLLKIEDISKRDYAPICRRRLLYCHETCHIIAMLRAFPSGHTDVELDKYAEALFLDAEQKDDAEERAFLRKTETTLEERLDNISLMSNISFDDESKSPADFNRCHFPYHDDKLNYFKLFNELLVSDDKLKASVKDMNANIKRYQRRNFSSNNRFDFNKYFNHFLHIDLTHIMNRAPEKRKVLMDELRNL